MYFYCELNRIEKKAPFGLSREKSCFSKDALFNQNLGIALIYPIMYKYSSFCRFAYDLYLVCVPFGAI